jgi:hypothetical protein
VVRSTCKVDLSHLDSGALQVLGQMKTLSIFSLNVPSLDSASHPSILLGYLFATTKKVCIGMGDSLFKPLPRGNSHSILGDLEAAQ